MFYRLWQSDNPQEMLPASHSKACASGLLQPYYRIHAYVPAISSILLSGSINYMCFIKQSFDHVQCNFVIWNTCSNINSFGEIYFKNCWKNKIYNEHFLYNIVVFSGNMGARTLSLFIQKERNILLLQKCGYDYIVLNFAENACYLQFQ